MSVFRLCWSLWSSTCKSFFRCVHVCPLLLKNHFIQNSRFPVVTLQLHFEKWLAAFIINNLGFVQQHTGLFFYFILMLQINYFKNILFHLSVCGFTHTWMLVCRDKRDVTNRSITSLKMLVYSYLNLTCLQNSPFSRSWQVSFWCFWIMFARTCCSVTVSM